MLQAILYRFPKAIEVLLAPLSFARLENAHQYHFGLREPTFFSQAYCPAVGRFKLALTWFSHFLERGGVFVQCIQNSACHYKGSDNLNGPFERFRFFFGFHFRERLVGDFLPWGACYGENFDCTLNSTDWLDGLIKMIFILIKADSNEFVLKNTDNLKNTHTVQSELKKRSGKVHKFSSEKKENFR